MRAISLVVGSDPLTGIGGHARYVRTQARALQGIGFEPHIFCVSRRSNIVETDIGVVHHVWSPFRPFTHYMLPFNGPILVGAVQKFLKGRSGPHLIHCFQGWSWVGVRVSSHFRRRGIAVTSLVTGFDTRLNSARAKFLNVDRAHGLWVKLKRAVEYYWTALVVSRYETDGYLRSDRAYVNYETTRRLMLRSFGDNLRVRVLPYASETAFTEEMGERRSITTASGAAPTIVSVSRHETRKGLPVLLRALKQLADDGIQFQAVLVGGGPLLEQHRLLARELGIAHRVAIPGFVPSSYEYLRCADVFVLPSLAEGSGSLSLLEALQAEVPIVASRVDGIPEDVTDGENALLVEPGDTTALANALRRLLLDVDMRRRLASEGRATFVGKFSAKVFMNALRCEYASFGFGTGVDD
jgi:glycosyltransferase involved in cell wall biosynthesis